MATEELMVGIDIGSSKVAAVIGECSENSAGVPVLSIVGVGEYPTDGVRGGVIINIESTVNSIREAVKAAGEMADYEVESLCCGIGGSHVSGINSSGVAPVRGKRSGNAAETSENDMKAACDSASAVALGADEMKIGTVPLFYRIDGNLKVPNPENMLCSRLEAEVHIIKAGKTAVNNLTHTVSKAGFEVKATAPSSLAICKAVLTDDEKRSGILLIDLGADVTSVTVSVENAPYCTESVKIGGKYITSDISKVLRIPFDIAEEIKIKDGVCHETYLKEGNETILPLSCGDLAGRTISCTEICEIIQARLWEIFEEVAKILDEKNQIMNVYGGIVLTGGGALIPGICELATEYFGIQARAGNSVGFEDATGMAGNTRYAVAMGLVKNEFENRFRSTSRIKRKRTESSYEEPDNTESGGPLFFLKRRKDKPKKKGGSFFKGFFSEE